MNEISKEKLEELARKWQAGTITPEEQQVFDGWYNIQQDEDIQWPKQETSEEVRERLFHSITTKVHRAPSHVIHMYVKKIWKVAAAAVIVGVIAGWWYLSGGDNKGSRQLAITHNPVSSIKPGSTHATLQLNSGRIITLSAENNDTAFLEEGSKIILEDNFLVYQSVANRSSSNIFHTVSAPRGGQYQIKLSDGTRVWLNAASSVRFPANFDNNVRHIEVTGEVYLEVAKDKNKPFKVDISGSTVEVLGTSFNINAYENEPALKTTLIEGKVKVQSKSGNEVLLSPGQQSIEDENKNLRVEKALNIEKVIAWKSGVFNFHNETLHSILRQLSRWYDVEVVYENKVPDLQFWGEMQRDLPLSDVLEILKKLGIKFRIENKKLIVMQ